MNSETGFDVKNLDPRPVELAVTYSTLDICLFLLDYQGKLKRSVLNCQYCTIILCVREYSFAEMTQSVTQMVIAPLARPRKLRQ